MIELFPYNQKDYDAMKAMLRERGRAGVVKPPSEGKAMLGMHLAEEEPDKLVLWVNPNTLHIEAQKRNAITQSEKGGGVSHDFSNVVTMTYTALMKMAETGKMPVLDRANPGRKPDYIILDEVHHAGAPKWGEGVDALLAACPQAQVVGFTATPIRHQDGGLDMMEKLFEDALAVNLTVIDSWNDPERPLVPPSYVRTYYSKEEELDRLASLREQAAKMPESATGRREKVQSDIDRLAKYVEDADGVDEVMAKRIAEPDAKVIVFCKDKEHLYELAAPEKVREWFGNVNSEVNIYPIESSRDDCLEMLERYTNDESSALKVLYAIDMFNESLHVKGCRYAIMARPTESPNIWLQQMGRVFEKDKHGRNGVIIDLARNYSRAKGYVSAMKGGRSKTLGERESVSERDYIAQVEKAIGSSRVTDMLAEYSELVEDIKENLSYTVVDHTGRDFKSQKDMCEYWGIDRLTYRARIKRGWTVEKALTLETKANEKLGVNVDHLGNKYPTFRAMCEAWGISETHLRRRLQNGFSLEEALSTPVKKNEKPCTDHLGNEYPSQAALCEAWGIEQFTFRSRIELGWSMEETLTGNHTRKGNRHKTCTDHEGNLFPSVKDMCEHWGVTYPAYSKRIRTGKTLEEALTGKSTKIREECFDHLGNKFSTLKDMSEAWGVNYGTFKSRLNRGASIEEALTGVRKEQTQYSPAFTQKNEPRKEKSSASRKPGELKSAGAKPKQPGVEKAVPIEDGRVCSASAAARGVEAQAHEVRRQK